MLLCFTVAPAAIAGTGTFVSNKTVSFNVGWQNNTPGCVGYDNRVYETDHFLVISNGTSDDNRIKLANYLETAYTNIKSKLGISDGDIAITISDSNSKFVACADTQNLVTNYQGSGAYRSLLLNAIDSKNPMYDPSYFSDFTSNDYAGLQALIQHELTHTVVQSLSNDRNFKTDRWFSEGFATFIGGYPSSGKYNKSVNVNSYETADFFKNWPTNYVNPITVKKSSDIPTISGVDSYQQDNYTLYALIVEWLTDTTTNGGAGNTISDMTALFKYRASTGADFGAAFPQVVKRNGAALTLADLQANWQTWITTYLNTNTNALAFNQATTPTTPTTPKPPTTNGPGLIVTPLIALNGTTRTITILPKNSTTPKSYGIKISNESGNYPGQTYNLPITGSFSFDWTNTPGQNLYLIVIERDINGFVSYSNEVAISTTQATTTISQASADSLFNWAEKTYPTLFSPAAQTQTVTDGYSRTYTGIKIVVTLSNSHLLATMPPSTQPIDLGDATPYISQAKSSGF